MLAAATLASAKRDAALVVADSHEAAVAAA
jgi:hypothetical protein